MSCDENRIIALQTLRESWVGTNLTATQSFKAQNYCDNESIFVILDALKCARSVLQSWLDKWKSYVIVDWSARREATVQIRKSWAKSLRRHLNWRSDTNLTATKSSRSHNYFDNESISFIFTALKCAHSALQLWLNKWESYVVADWCAWCEVIARYWNVLRWSWRMFRLRTKIKYWLNLSTLTNTNAELIRILPGRSSALSEYTEHFFIDCVLFFENVFWMIIITFFKIMFDEIVVYAFLIDAKKIDVFKF